MTIRCLVRTSLAPISEASSVRPPASAMTSRRRVTPWVMRYRPRFRTSPETHTVGICCQLEIARIKTISFGARGKSRISS